MRYLYAGICLLLIALSAKSQHVYTEHQKTDHLISYIRNLKNATLIANGKEYTPDEAAHFLQMERQKAGKKVVTARDFIDSIATGPVTDHYKIRYKNGKRYYCGKVLKIELHKLETGEVKPYQSRYTN